MHEILNWSNLFYNKLLYNITSLVHISWSQGNQFYLSVGSLKVSRFTCFVLRSPPGRWPSCPCSCSPSRVRPWRCLCRSHAPHVSDTRSWVGSGSAPSPPRTRSARVSWQPAPGQCSWQLNTSVSTTRDTSGQAQYQLAQWDPVRTVYG